MKLIDKFSFSGPDVSEDIRKKYGFNGDLLRQFSENNGPVVHKWHHYIPIYDRYFSQFRNQPIRFLEIGVSKGGSLQLWREYFGEDAIIYGIDIDEDCIQFDGQSGNVRIGSQDDPNFLKTVVEEMGGIDLVLDDGSHVMKHIDASLRTLFPLLNEGGIYMIEDLHTAYWKKWGGGYYSGKNFFGVVRKLADDMHKWYHGRKIRVPELYGLVSGLHIHDSIVVLDKGPVFPPVHSQVGDEE